MTYNDELAVYFLIAIKLSLIKTVLSSREFVCRLAYSVDAMTRQVIECFVNGRHVISERSSRFQGRRLTQREVFLTHGDN